MKGDSYLHNTEHEQYYMQYYLCGCKKGELVETLKTERRKGLLSCSVNSWAPGPGIFVHAPCNITKQKNVILFSPKLDILKFRSVFIFKKKKSLRGLSTRHCKTL